MPTLWKPEHVAELRAEIVKPEYAKKSPGEIAAMLNAPRKTGEKVPGTLAPGLTEFMERLVLCEQVSEEGGMTITTRLTAALPDEEVFGPSWAQAADIGRIYPENIRQVS